MVLARLPQRREGEAGGEGGGRPSLPLNWRHACTSVYAGTSALSEQGMGRDLVARAVNPIGARTGEM